MIRDTAGHGFDRQWLKMKVTSCFVAGLGVRLGLLQHVTLSRLLLWLVIVTQNYLSDGPPHINLFRKSVGVFWG